MPKILLIEDEVNIRLFISINLKARGYTVEESETGMKGLQLMRETSPNALILDMLLPDMTGWHVLDAMSKEEQLKHIPVILMTASVNIGETTNYPNLVRHVMKPASVDVVLEALRAAV
jgi:CheY-like chemotaxis protein